MGKVTIREYEVSEFRGNFPDVPTAAGVDLDALRAQDNDAMFISLPIIPKIGATSQNGLLYDEALADSIIAQINTKRPEGIFGHLKDEDRATSYPEAAAIWIGAKKENGAVWAKAFLASPTAKERIRRLKATGGQIATSIYGKGDYETIRPGVRRLTNFDLESLDFAPPARAALRNGSQPNVTAELEQEIPEMTKEEVVAELTVADIPAPLREQIVTELQTTVSELQATVAEYQRREFDALLDSRVAELTAWQVTTEENKRRLESFRRTLRNSIVSKLAGQHEATVVAETIDAVWADLQPIAETVRDALAGPAAVVSGKVKSSTAWRDELVANAGKMRAERGI